MSAPKPPHLAVIGAWLVQEVNQCTCGGPIEYHGHERGCGYEPVVKLDELKAALTGSGYTLLAPKSGGRDAWTAANRAVMDWIDADPGRGLVGCTPSMVAQLAVDAFLAAGGLS